MTKCDGLKLPPLIVHTKRVKRSPTSAIKRYNLMIMAISLTVTDRDALRIEIIFT